MNVFVDIDGRETTFWRVRESNYNFDRLQLVSRLLYRMRFLLDNRFTEYQHYYGYNQPSISRNLNDTVEISTKKEVDDQINTNIIFEFFFILSQLGGLYSFFM